MEVSHAPDGRLKVAREWPLSVCQELDERCGPPMVYRQHRVVVCAVIPPFHVKSKVDEPVAALPVAGRNNGWPGGMANALTACCRLVLLLVILQQLLVIPVLSSYHYEMLTCGSVVWRVVRNGCSPSGYCQTNWSLLTLFPGFLHTGSSINKPNNSNFFSKTAFDTVPLKVLLLPQVVLVHHVRLHVVQIGSQSAQGMMNRFTLEKIK